MGRLAWQAVMSRDAALVLGCTLVAALGVIVGNLAADLLAAAVDPRTREAR
jgi:peptide/nickel transport system permease protein